MRKLLFIAALTIGMVGCTSVEEVIQEVTPSQITLQGVTKKATRGGLDGTILPDKTNIYCSGLRHNGGSITPWFTNQTFTTTSAGTWMSEGVIWPMDGTMDFWAYTCAAYNNELVTGTTYTTEIYNTIKPTASFNTSATGFSSLVLNFGNNLDGKNDVMVSNVVNGIDCSGKTNTYKQSLEFQHTMAWIVVRIEAIGSAYNDKMMFHEITLDNVKVSGTLTVDATSPLTWSWTPYQTISGIDDTKSVRFPAFGEGSSSTGVLLGDASSKPRDGILVLPQTPTQITLKYAYQEGSSFENVSTHIIDLTSLSGKLTDGSDYTGTPWEAGKKYVYTCRVDTSTDKVILLCASVSDYVEVDYSYSI